MTVPETAPENLPANLTVKPPEEIVPELTARPVSVAAPMPDLSGADQRISETVTVDGVGFAPVKQVAGSANSDASASLESADAEDPSELGGIFDKPGILTLQCQHDVVLNQGRTVVRLSFSGWGKVTVDAVQGPNNFRFVSWNFSTGIQHLDLIVPLQSALTVSVRNVFGEDKQELQIAESTAMLPVRPPVADVIGTRMPNLLLPVFSTNALQQQIPDDFRIVPRELKKLPPFSVQTAWLQPVRLKEKLGMEISKAAALPQAFGRRQQYQRHLLSAECSGVSVPDVNIAHAQDKLKAWINEVHHGTDHSHSS